MHLQPLNHCGLFAGAPGLLTLLLQKDACDDYVANDTANGDIASLRTALADREENCYGQTSARSS